MVLVTIENCRAFVTHKECNLFTLPNATTYSRLVYATS